MIILNHIHSTMKHFLVIATGLALSLAPVQAQQSKKADQQKESTSPREILRELEVALKPHRDKMDELSRKVDADIKPLREQQEQLAGEITKQLEPLHAQRESVGQKFQHEVDSLADSNPNPYVYEQSMQRIRATYDPQGEKIVAEIEAVQKRFDSRAQAIQQAMERVYSKYEPDRKKIQDEIDKVNAKYRKQLDALRAEPVPDSNSDSDNQPNR